MLQWNSAASTAAAHTPGLLLNDRVPLENRYLDTISNTHQTHDVSGGASRQPKADALE